METNYTGKKYKRRVLIVSIALWIIVVIAAVLYYRNQSVVIKATVYDELEKVSELKSKQIKDWHKDRVSNINIFSKSSFFYRGVKDALTLKGESLDKLRERLAIIKKFYDYENIFITASDGEILAADTNITVKVFNTTKEILTKSYNSLETTVSAIYRDSSDNTYNIDFAAPVKYGNEPLIAMLVFRIDTKKYLFPLFESWNLENTSEKTLVLHKDSVNRSIIFYNQTETAVSSGKHHTHDSCIIAGLPFSGEISEAEGIDHYGDYVYANVSYLPEIKSYLITKINRDEVLKSLNSLMVLVGIISTSILLVVVFYVNSILNRRERNFLEEKYLHEKNLAEINEEFKTTLYNLGEAVIITTTNGIIKNMNPEACQLTEWNEKEAIGKTLPEIFKLKDEKSRDILENSIAKIKETQKKLEQFKHILLITKSAKEIQISYSINIILNKENKETGFVLVFRDRTLQIQKNRALMESEERYRLIFEKSPIGLMRYNTDCILETCNDSFAGILNTEKTNLIGLDMKNLPNKKMSDLIMKALKGDSTYYEDYYTSIFSNKTLYGKCVFTPIKDNDNNITGGLGIVQDISEQKNYELQLLEAKEKAEEANRVKSNFLANMSHELRTPLNGILGFSDILSKDLEIPEYKRMAALIHKNGNRLHRTLSNILNLTKLEGDKIIPSYKKFNLNYIINELVNDYEISARNKKTEIKFLQQLENTEIVSDSLIIKDILDHIINNAVTFTSYGSITIIIGEEIIENTKYTSVNITDTGIGIEEELFDQIFEDFRQASEGRGRSFEGSGIGLSIVKYLAQLMKIKLVVESEVNKGSTFIILIPEHSEDVISDKEETPQIIIRKKEKDKKSILIIDDDESTNKLTNIFLSPYYNMDIAYSAEEGINKCLYINYDLILLDINLGKGLTGLDLLQIIRMKKKNYNDIPIIACTAFVMSGDREEFISHGCTDYISKPFSRQDLLNVIKKYI